MSRMVPVLIVTLADTPCSAMLPHAFASCGTGGSSGLTLFEWKSQHPLDQSARLNLATQAATVRYSCGTAPNWSATMISIPRLILCAQRTIACMHHFHPGYASQLLLLSTWTLRQNQTRFQHYPQQFAPVTVRSSAFATLNRHDVCRLACSMASSPRRITMMSDD